MLVEFSGDIPANATVANPFPVVSIVRNGKTTRALVE